MALITVGADDPLADYIASGQAELERVTDRLFEHNAAFVESLPQVNGVLYPRLLPLVSVASVHLDGQAVTHEVQGNTIIVGGGLSNHGTLYRLYATRPAKLYSVTYAGGFAPENVPEDLITLVKAYGEFVREFQSLSSGYATGSQAGVSRTRLRHMKAGVPSYLFDRSQKWRRKVPGVTSGTY